MNFVFNIYEMWSNVIFLNKNLYIDSENYYYIIFEDMSLLWIHIEHDLSYFVYLYCIS